LFLYSISFKIFIEFLIEFVFHTFKIKPSKNLNQNEKNN
jgi:hypothetical protein